MMLENHGVGFLRFPQFIGEVLEIALLELLLVAESV